MPGKIISGMIDIKIKYLKKIETNQTKCVRYFLTETFILGIAARH